MGATDIEWTGTKLPSPLVLTRRVRLDADVFLEVGSHTLLPGFTFNPWVGCEKISPACKHCYAEAWSKRVGYTKSGSRRLAIWGPAATTPRVRTSAENWKRPRRWNRIAGDLGVRFKVFCASLADVGEDHALVASWRAELFDLIDATPNLDWLVLTKRPENIAELMPPFAEECGINELTHEVMRRPAVRPNLWLGVSCENQATADERIPHLLRTPAAVRFLSVEPLLSAVDLSEWMHTIRVVHNGDGDTQEVPCRPDIHWSASSVMVP
jgi:protein gp37